VNTTHQSADVIRIRDAGLQAERTAPAWSRTALAVLANGILALRAGWVSGQQMIGVLAAALLLAAATMFAYGVWRRRELQEGHGPVAPPAWAIGATASIALAACAVGLAAVLVTGFGFHTGSDSP
jgi:uncharacterized membrane protein YidH (DUF202 family)